MVVVVMRVCEFSGVVLCPAERVRKGKNNALGTGCKMLEPTMLGWGHGGGELEGKRSCLVSCFAVPNAQSTLQRTHRTAVNR